uniref:Uncharacterized protein n=2 Tax=Phaeocystis antarctica TaxID=33657 RepID=A0A7S0HGC6_9EUKA
MMGLSKEDEMLTMGPGDMVDAVCRGLTDNDRGAEDEGFSRLYQFMTPQGRTYMAPPPPRSGRLDGVALDFFVDNACDPVFGLVGCDYYTILETTVSPATQTRGGLGTCKVRFESSLHSYLDSQRCTRSDGSSSVGRGAERVALGTGDKALQALVDAEEDEDDDDGQAGGVEAQEPMSGLVNDRQAVAKTRQVQSRTLLFGLEQQRRPPLEGVWLIKEVLPLEQTLFQVINKGSTEDW